MSPFRSDFIRFLLESEVLRFGNFVTKSGRETPYFINTGMIRTGAQLERLGEYYARTIRETFGDRVDNLYGPAYKGIPLAVSAAASLFRLYGVDLGVTFNRKEVKNHGEGGALVGQPYDRPTRVVIVEDVITAGTSIRESMEILKGLPNVEVIGMVVSVDRKERLDATGRSALGTVADRYGLRTAALIDIDDLIDVLRDPEVRKSFSISDEQLPRMLAYRETYGAEG